MRPDWHQYFFGIVFMTAKRASCNFVHAGAVLVKNKTVIATGYNGSPAGTDHCLLKGCLKEQLIEAGEKPVCRGICAEHNAILSAAKHGINTNDATLYASYAPDYETVKMLINAGITEIIYMEDALGIMAKQLLKEANVKSGHYSLRENDLYPSM